MIEMQDVGRYDEAMSDAEKALLSRLFERFIDWLDPELRYQMSQPEYDDAYMFFRMGWAARSVWQGKVEQ